MTTFGEKLRNLRIHTGLTQKQLAEKLAIEQSFLSYLENDKSTPNPEVFNKILNIFDITASELIESLDPAYTQKYLNHIPMIAEQKLFDKSMSNLKVVYNKFTLSIICILLIGGIMILLGSYGILFSNINYRYVSNGYYEIDKSEIIPIKDELNSPNYLGEIYLESSLEENGIDRSYIYQEQFTRYHILNKYFVIIGIAFSITALFLLLFEARLRELWRIS